MFLIKQVSSDLGITPQAIYKQKEELQNKGYMIKNSSNDWEITSDGYNYLKEKQINRFKRNNISLKENDIKSTNLQGKEENNSLNETLNSKLYILVVIGIVSAFGPFVTDFYLPALPVLTGYFDTTASLVQLSLTFSMVGLVVGQLVIGPLSDKYGRKKTLMASLVLFCIST